jgi:hypothetical protein
LLGQSAHSHFGFIFASWSVIEEVMKSVWMYGVHGILFLVGWLLIFNSFLGMVGRVSIFRMASIGVVIRAV